MPSAADFPHRDPIKPWFDALESCGEYIGVRFGRVPPGSSDPEWTFLPHSEFDGVGGFAHLLRQGGVALDSLPRHRHATPPSWGPFLRAVPEMLKPRRRLAWKTPPAGEAPQERGRPSPAVAWHVFTDEETGNLLRHSRGREVTLNSLLMKHLDDAIRPDLATPDAATPWMIPVNLRGAIDRHRDTANHTSYVSITIEADETLREVHARIYRALSQGEHWANWRCYSVGRLLPAAAKRHLARTDRVVSQWNIGGFSNMGSWDPEGTIASDQLAGSWLFCPPVLRCQMVGAGCITFQQRLSLLIQTHPELTTAPEVPAKWIDRWVSSLRAELSGDPAIGGAPAAVVARSGPVRQPAHSQPHPCHPTNPPSSA